MNDEAFWRLLDELDWRHQGDDDRVVAPVVEALSGLPLIEIESFQQILARKLYALDGRAWAREIGSGWWGGDPPVSADEFLYARCAALTNGREQYEAVLRDPSQMPKDLEFESLLYIGPKAWEAKTGSEGDLDTDVSYETFSNEAGWPPADPEPEMPFSLLSIARRSQEIVKFDHGKSATRGVIRALIKGDIDHPVLTEHLAATSRVLVMTPGSGIEPPREPDQPKGGSAPPWIAAIELWTVGEDGDKQPSGFVARIELDRVSPTEVSARLVGVEAKGSPAV